MKKIIGIILLLVAFAFTADYKPFTFENIPNDSASQQTEFDYLLKYKMFGANGITFNGQNIKVPDKSGWFGTADGNFELREVDHIIGGPILVGGDISFDNGQDGFTTGPVRVSGDVIVKQTGFKDRANVSAGFNCVAGTVDPKFANIVANDSQFFGDNYTNCPQSVPEIKTTLRTPTFKDDTITYKEAILQIGGIYTLDIANYCDLADTTKKLCDIYIEKITLNNDARLYVKMPVGGKLTRIFLKEGLILDATHPQIRVMYGDNVIRNDKYSGNLLIYSTKDFIFEALAQTDSMQGTFITTGKIHIKQQMTLAGQLLSNNLFIDANFDGSGFIYVKFDPDTLNIDPELNERGGLVENDTTVVIPIKLSDTATIDVYFSYCFELNDKVDSSDFNLVTDFPVCGIDTKTVKIPVGSKVPTDSIKINVKRDDITETSDSLIIKIKIESGAVLPNNETSGELKIKIIDAITKNTSVVLDKTDTIKSYQEELRIPPGTGVVGNIKYTDDGIAPLIWSVEDPSGLFTVVDGVIKTNHVFDYETEDTTYVIKVKVADGEFLDSANYLIKIVNVQEPITITGKVDKVNENSEIGTPVGVINGKDADSTAVSYTINTTDFKIDQLTGVITSNTLLDFETKSSYPVKVTITSTDGSKKDTSFTIYVNDVDEPVHAHDTTITVNENTTGIIGKVTGEDEDGKPVKFYSNDTLHYVVDSITGTIRLVEPFDYETTKNDTLKVIVKDVNGNTDTATVIINVDNVDETVKITAIDHEPKKDTIKTNDPDHNIEWKLCEGAKCDYDTLDVVIKKDTTIKVCNEKKTVCDSVVILFNDAPPVVTLTNAKSTDALIDYITIEEEKDDKIYVNKKNNEITVTVKDTVHKSDKHFNIDVTLDTVATKDIKLTEYNYLIDETKAKVVPIGNNLAELVEVIKVDGVEVELKQVIDTKTGKPVDTVQTVTYTKKVGGKNVVVSYKTDNLTGQKIGDYEVSYMIDSCTKVTYTVDDNKKIVKNKEGNIAYTIAYEYTDDYGNKASAKVEIIFDDIPPKVEILNPIAMESFNTNAIPVKWTVNGEVQDTLTLQRLEKGINHIIRRYVDKAGNVAEDTITVIMREAKDIDISLVHPVTKVDQDKVDEYYSNGHKYNDKKPYDVKFVDPKNDTLPETIGVGFKIDIVLPSVSPTGSLATLDDIVKNGMIPVDDKGNIVGASTKGIPVETYVAEHCTDEFIEDYKKNGLNIPLYDVTYNLHLWVYTNNANYVNDFNIEFTLNDEAKTTSAGTVQMVIDWLSDKDGNVKAKNGHALGTGAYITKLWSKSIAKHRCDYKEQKKGDRTVKKDDTMKIFGYKRPNDK